MRDAIAIERLASAWPAQRHETAALLRGCRRFFSFDPYTAMVDEALMCGAEVHFIREDGSVEKYFADPDEMYRENVRLYYDTASVSAFLGLLEARWG
jgi:hypothetical protein